MKKMMALTTFTLAACMAHTALGQTTSTTKVDVSKQSFKERIGGYYWGAVSKGVLSKEEKDETDSSFLNYLNASYKLGNDTKISTTFRFQLKDSLDENGKGDRFRELDQRIAVGTTFFSNGKYTAKAALTIELPISRASKASGKTMRVRPSASLSAKIDNVNTLTAWTGFYKDIYPKANKSIDETTRYMIVNVLTYNNTYLSEKYSFKAEYIQTLSHNPGYADSALKKDHDDTLDLGLEMDVLGFSINPYIQHKLSEMRALNNVGGGVQIFKAF